MQIMKRFWRNREGGAAPMLALAAIPLMASVGAAIDYSRASSVRTSFQAALDSTALMLSKEAHGMAGPSPANRCLRSKALRAFAGAMPSP